MRVLVVNTNRLKSPQTIIPFGACLVASSAESAGHDVRFLDLCFDRHPANVIQRAAREFAPEVVGLSIRNLDSCDYLNPRSYLPEIRQIVAACRRTCDAAIVLGGPAVSQAPEALVRYLGADHAIAGEGEQAFPALLGNVQRSTLNVQHSKLSGVPDPQLSKWLDLRRYAAYQATMPIQTKRGCAFKCSYCVYPLLEGSEWRLFEPERVADQVAGAKDSGLRMVEFVDSVFGMPATHSLECCRAIEKLGNHLPLSALELNPSACSTDLMDAMNAAGFTAVGITAESGSDAMLDRLNKGFTSDHLRQALKNLRQINAQRLWIFLIGAPGETEATVRETVRFIEELPHSDLVFITHGVRILPRTALRESLVAQGIISADDELIQPTFYYSPDVTPQRVNKLLAESSFPIRNVTTINDGGHPLIPLVQRIASTLSLEPPYWRYLPKINLIRRVTGL